MGCWQACSHNMLEQQTCSIQSTLDRYNLHFNMCLDRDCLKDVYTSLSVLAVERLGYPGPGTSCIRMCTPPCGCHHPCR